jgi:hypothetical protein
MQEYQHSMKLRYLVLIAVVVSLGLLVVLLVVLSRAAYDQTPQTKNIPPDADVYVKEIQN